MRKLLSVITILTFILIMTCSISFAQDLTVNDEPIDINGISMTADDFKETFSGKPETRKALQSTRSLSNATISIDNVTINGEGINFLATMWINGQVVSLPITGQLCAGHKSQHDFNSIIINVTEPVKGYEILLFEIFNDTTDNEQLVNSLTEQIETEAPYVKIYIQDQNNTIYLFESEMPECFSKLAAEDYPSAPKEKDALWAKNLVIHNVTQVPVTDKLLNELGIPKQTRANGDTTTWCGDTINRDEFYVNGNKTVCCSLPYLEYRHANITTGNSTWFAYFYVVEFMESAGYTYYGNNVFEYHNLKIGFVRGDNTMFLRTYQEGRLYDKYAIGDKLKEARENITVKLFKETISKLPAGGTLLEIFEYINMIPSTNQTVTLGASGVELEGEEVFAVGKELTSYILEENTFQGGKDKVGHYFKLQTDLTYDYENSTTDTIGGLFLEYDTYYVTDFSTRKTKEYFPLVYSALRN